MDDHESAIHWSCVIQEVTKRINPEGYGTAGEYGDAVVAAASKIWDWHERILPTGTLPQTARSDNDPGPTPPIAGPVDEWPEDEAIGPPQKPEFVPPAQGPAGQTNPVCLCGAEKPWNPQHQGWFCPNQKKSRDPAVQAQQKREHPPTWP